MRRLCPHLQAILNNSRYRLYNKFSASIYRDNPRIPAPLNLSNPGAGCNQAQHVPPRWWDSKFSPYKGHQTFCVLRDPLDKMLSEFKMRRCYKVHHREKTYPGCTSEAAEEYMQMVLNIRGSGICSHSNPLACGRGCHCWADQHLYVFDAAGRRTCDYIIKYNASTFISVLSAVVGKNCPRLLAQSVDGGFHKANRYHANASSLRISQKTALAIRHSYAKDYALLRATV